MPKFKKLSPEEIAELSKRNINVEIVKYVNFLKDLQTGDWAQVSLNEDEKPRTVKLRLTKAANKLERKLRFKKQVDKSVLVFEIVQ